MNKVKTPCGPQRCKDVQLKWPKSTYGIQIPKFYQGPILSTTVHRKY